MPEQNDGIEYQKLNGVRLGYIVRVDYGRSDWQGPTSIQYVFENGTRIRIARGDRPWSDYFEPVDEGGWDLAIHGRPAGTAAGLLYEGFSNGGDSSSLVAMTLLGVLTVALVCCVKK
jgi:hypothetical protein